MSWYAVKHVHFMCFLWGLSFKCGSERDFMVNKFLLATVMYIFYAEKLGDTIVALILSLSCIDLSIAAGTPCV